VTAAAPPRVLSHADEIDGAWIASVLDNAGVVHSPIERIAVESIGHGTMGSTLRVRIDYAGEADEAPVSLVCKLEAPGASAHDIARSAGIYAREASAYGLFAKSARHRTPRAFFCGTGEENGAITLVLEDMAGWQPGQQTAGCTACEAGAAAVELARLHSSYWGRDDYPEIAFIMNRASNPERYASIYHAGMAGLIDMFGERIDPADLAIVRRFAPLVEHWCANPGRKTLIHGDARLDNMLFDHREPDLVGCCLIDWQAIGLGHPMQDLTYFTTGALDPDLRRAIEGGLIAAYQAIVAEVDPGFTLAEAQAGYRRNSIAGLMNTVGAALSIAPGEHNDALMLALVARNTAAVRDWDGLAVLEAEL
jgi:hypothetical protein